MYLDRFGLQRIMLVILFAGIGMVDAMVVRGRHVTAQETRPVISPDNAAEVEEIIVLRGHVPKLGNEVVDAQLTTDGQTLVSAGTDNTVRVWNMPDGVQRAVFQGYVKSMALSPDDQSVAFSTSDGLVIQRDLATGDVTLLLEAKGGSIAQLDVTTDLTLRIGALNSSIERVTYSADGTRLAFVLNNTIVVWTFADETSVILSNHSDLVTDIALSPDGLRLLSTGFDHTVRLWNLDTQDEVTLSDQSFDYCVAFSPDGSLAAAGGSDGIRLWDVTTYQMVNKLPGEVGNGRLSFSPDGRMLVFAVGFSAEVVEVWDVQTRQMVATLTGHEDKITDVTFSPDGRWVITASEDDTIRLWGIPIPEDNVVSTGGVSGFSPIARDKFTTTIIRQNIDDLEQLLTLDGAGEHPYAVAFSPDSVQVAVGGDAQVVQVWDIETQAELAVLEGHTDTVTSLAFSPDGRSLAAGSFDETVMLWDLATGDLTRTFFSDQGAISDIAFSPDGSQLMAGWDAGVTIWDTQTGAVVMILEARDTLAFALSVDGQTAATSHRNFDTPSPSIMLFIWDLSTGQITDQYPIEDQQLAKSLAFSPNGNLLAVGTGSGMIYMLDLETGEMAQTLASGQDSVDELVFGRNHSFLLSRASVEVIIWDVLNGAPLKVLPGWAIDFSADGTLIAAADLDLDGGNWYMYVNLWGVSDTAD